MTRTAILALALGLLAPELQAGTAAGAHAKAPSGKTFAGHSFECALPGDWRVQQESDGVTALGPRDENKVAAQISVRYFPPGSKPYDTAAAYIGRRTAPNEEAAALGWKTGKPEPALVAGRKAQRVVGDMSEFVPPRSLKTKEVPMVREDVAVPAARGFYLLTFYAPKSLAAAQRKAFARVLATFTPSL